MLPKNVEKFQKNTKNPGVNLFLRCPNTLQNKLLSKIISEKTGFPTTCGLHYGLIEPCDLVNKRHLILIDCHNLELDQIWSSLAMNAIIQGNHFLVAFFNVRPGLADPLESVALNRGIRGVFYEEQPIDMLLKGIQVMVNGELWFSRKAICRVLKRTIATNQTNLDPIVALTPREKEILSLIGAGDSNHEMAEKLHLSIHTIKTHIYNLFKKIEVPNRLQAVLWAAQHLPYM